MCIYCQIDSLCLIILYFNLIISLLYFNYLLSIYFTFYVQKYVILDQIYEIYQPALIYIPTLTEYEFCFSVFQLTEQQVVSCRPHGQANLPVHLPPVQPV